MPQVHFALRVPYQPLPQNPMPNEFSLQAIAESLRQIQAVLERIEQRQIKTTAAVMEVKEHEAPVVGSFATTEEPKP